METNLGARVKECLEDLEKLEVWLDSRGEIEVREAMRCVQKLTETLVEQINILERELIRLEGEINPLEKEVMRLEAKLYGKDDR